MTRRRGSVALGLLAFCLAAMFAGPAALAKGPTQGVITGPGLEHPIELRTAGSETIGADLATVIMRSGFSVGMWGGTPAHGRVIDRPGEDLGPRYTITYTMALPDLPTADVVQYVYPYVEPYPVTYMPADQRYWGRERTVGAWYAAGVGLRRTLVGLGLPASPTPAAGSPAGGGSQDDVPGGASTLPWWIVGAVVAATAAAGVSRRRRARRVAHA